MPKFGTSKTGQSRPRLPLLRIEIECDEARPGQIFVDQGAILPEFPDLILPHVEDPNKPAALTLGVSTCWPLQEEDNEELAAVSQPAATQPLRVILAEVGEDARPATTDLNP